MVIVIFRARMRPGSEEAALHKMRTMAEAVEEKEPKTLAYMLHRSKDDPAELVFYEVYADDETFQAHAQTPHMGEMRAAFGDLFDTTSVKLERLDEVAGFMRGG
jgi:quinol monooxygenase YgiN